LRAADQPIETWSSCMALDGIESTDAGAASRLSSETMPADVYWAIMCPESTPGSSARNGDRPCERCVSSIGSARRSDRGEVGGGDREEVEDVADRGAVEVAVAHHPAVEGDHRVVDRAGQLPAGHRLGVLEGVAGGPVHLGRAAQAV